MKKLNFYNVDNQYIDYLKKFESKIPNINYENHKKFCCGILFEINGMKYIAPVSSFKKAQKTNFVIKNTNRQDISSIRFSFMFPIYDELISIKNFSNEDKLYKRLLNEELAYCNTHAEKIISKAQHIYNTVCNNRDPIIVNNCCDFKLLEQKCKIYQTAMELNTKEPPSSTIERLLKDFSADDIKEIIATSELAPHHKTMLNTELIKSLDIDVPTKNICR